MAVLKEDPFREGDFLAWIARTIRPSSRVAVGVGDDAAVARLAGRTVVLASDSVVEGVHFERGTSPALVGRKAMARVLSDFAAMACVPRFALLSLVAPPRWSAADVRAVVRGAARMGRVFGTEIVGGDAAAGPGPFVASVAIVGEPGPRGPVRRRGARPGDLLLATGAFGGSRLGRHLRFRPRVAEVLALAHAVRPHAAIDVSDGLSLDLARLCAASGVGATLEEAAIPISADARRASRRSGRSPLEHALEDGEDHEILLAIAPGDRERARRAAGCRVIGRFGAKGLRLRRRDGSFAELSARGYEHRSR